MAGRPRAPVYAYYVDQGQFGVAFPTAPPPPYSPIYTPVTPADQAGHANRTFNQPIPIKESFSIHVWASCLVFWLCGGLFGGIAFIIALKASDRASENNAAGARKLGNASLVVSAFGAITGVVVWAVGIAAFVQSHAVSTAVVTTTAPTTPRYPCNYICSGDCYVYSYYYGYSASTDCYRDFISACYSSPYCYTNQLRTTSTTTTTPSTTTKYCPSYTCGGTCYTYISYYYSESQCYSTFLSSCYANGYCYYNSNPTTTTRPSTTTTVYCTYYRCGSCYMYRSSSYTQSQCYANFISSCYSDYYCYYNSNPITTTLRPSTTPRCYYTCGGSCYMYLSYYYTQSQCYSNFISSCYSGYYCYYNSNPTTNTKISTTTTPYCYYTCSGSCYRYRTSSYTQSRCYSTFVSSCYSSGYCYYNANSNG